MILKFLSVLNNRSVCKKYKTTNIILFIAIPLRYLFFLKNNIDKSVVILFINDDS
jgi:hypothetical protein